MQVTPALTERALGRPPAMMAPLDASARGHRRPGRVGVELTTSEFDRVPRRRVLVPQWSTWTSNQHAKLREEWSRTCGCPLVTINHRSLELPKWGN